jgi:tetratricopeptide (TPR) repeat protein
LTLGAAAVAGALALPANQRGAAAIPFDPILSTGVQCVPQADRSRALIAALQKGAAKTETGPFAPPATTADVQDPADPPLWEGLGTASMKITTSSTKAQAYFDQGLRLAYAFNHAESRRAFRSAQKLDPACAMCYWGEALVLGPNINVPMAPEALAPAVAAARQAATLGDRATGRERVLIAALAQRYSLDPGADPAARYRRYAEAMGRVHARFPDDVEIAVLYAESLMVLQPWDYWESAGTKPKGRAAEMVAILERVLAAKPDHAGAIHYYIHVVEASSAPERAVPHADRLARAAPAAGHLVHMPSHAYYRVGRYLDSLEVNRRAVLADERLFAKADGSAVYRYVYYPHNLHFLMASAQMAGDGATAIEAARKLGTVISDDVARAVPLVQPIKASPYFTHAQFSRPATILAQPDPGATFPYVKAMWHYMRGVGFTALRAPQQARGEAEAIATIARTADFSDLQAAGIPGRDVLEIARLVLEGRIAQSVGHEAGAVDAFRRAVEIEDRLAYMEPPYWYYPVRQSLGAALLATGDLDGAERAFRESLARTPNNGWALYGLAKVHERRGEVPAAAAIESRFRQAWAGTRGALDLGRL